MGNIRTWRGNNRITCGLFVDQHNGDEIAAMVRGRKVNGELSREQSTWHSDMNEKTPFVT